MNKTTKIVLWIVVIALVIWGISCLVKKDSVTPVTPTTEKVIKIGAILPLTGPIASAGEFAKQGVELAVKDLLAEGKKVEVIFEDNAYDSKVALSAYNKLRTLNKVDVVVVFGSPAAMPLIPIVNQDQVPMLALTAAPAYSTPDDYAFRIVGTADKEAELTADVLIDKLGKKKIAVLYLNSDYGTGALAAFKKYAANRATIVAEESSAPGQSDYRAQLAKVKAANPDGIFLATLYREAGTILKQAKELGIKVPMMCGQPCDVPELFSTAGSAAEGLLVTAPTNKTSAKFAEEYQKSYGQDFLSYLTLRHYDAIKILSFVGEACQNSAYSGECIKKQLDDLSDFPGLSYQINFDNNGDINDQTSVKVARDGKYVPYE
ncbi:MAG: ABC transporter substrate-binding protein [Patescibacteria group bacterium]